MSKSTSAHAHDVKPCNKPKLDAAGLKLAGNSLCPPKLFETKWYAGQRFSVKDDPDRTRLPWSPPAFITFQDPVKRRAKLRVEKLDISRFLTKHDEKESFASVVHGVLTEKECAQFINAINKKGFTPALLNIGGGKQQYMPGYRKGWRMIADNSALTDWLFTVLQPHLPSRLPVDAILGRMSGREKFSSSARLVELNERCRFLCYEPSHVFKPHYDGCYVRSHGPKKGHFSRVTIQVYLHDLPEAFGGATSFLGRHTPPLPCQPRAGSVLVFTQNLYHEGSTVNRGLKYTFRTEAMYDPTPDAATKPTKKKDEETRACEPEAVAFECFS